MSTTGDIATARALRLNQSTLSTIHGVPVPTYPRHATASQLVHIGVGGFHRAHQAMYIDRLLSQGVAEWSICGIGTQPPDQKMAEVMAAQDGLYTLILKHPDGHLEPRVIGSIVDYVYAPADPERALEVMASPTTKIVSLTITEGGYQVDPATRAFSPTDPAVAADLEPGAVPATVFALVVEALRRRRSRNLPPFTVLSCDNTPGNGDTARAAFAGYAALQDAELGDWVSQHVAFPNSMVDRITPTTTDNDRTLAATQLGLRDEWPVVCEPFTQWILEDHFTAGRPPLEEVGVQLVPDVQPYELMKLRLLNAGHQALGYLGYLLGHRYAHQAATDPLLRDFVLAYMELEASPTLPPVPGIHLPTYRATLLERFSNPHIADTLQRLCTDGTDRIATFVLPVIRHLLTAGRDITRSTLIVAAWARYQEGTDEQGQPITVIDRALDTITTTRRQATDPAAFLDTTTVFGDLAQHPGFRTEFTYAFDTLHEHGVRHTLQQLYRPVS